MKIKSFLFFSVFMWFLCSLLGVIISLKAGADFISILKDILQMGIIIFFSCLTLISISIGLLLALNIARIKQLDKIDFEKSKELYREILHNYSPVTLSYLDQMNYNSNVAVVSGLLSLENKKYIKIENNEIKRIRYGTCNLDMPEKYIYENIRNNHVSINCTELLNIVENDCRIKGLIGIIEENRKKLQ